MFVLVILKKGFKESAISTGLFSFVLAQVARVFFQQSGNICKILEEGILGNIVRNHIYFRPVAHKD